MALKIWLVAGIGILAGVAARADNDPPKVKPEGPVWTVAPEFAFDGSDKKVAKKRRSLSGIACPAPSAGQRLCVAAFDEGGEARYVLVDRTSFTPQNDRIVLQDNDKELDAEGAARDQNTVYITGSHSPPRNASPPCSNPDSRHVYRFNVDATTGRAISGRDGKPVPPEDAKNRLWDALQKSKLSEFVGDGKCLGSPDHAINIEGLAAKSGALYFGLREPAKNETAYLVKVGADALFGQGALALDIYQFNVGSGRGIRDLLAVPEGILVLLGPDDDKKNNEPDPVSWRIALWDEKGSPNDVIKLEYLAELNLEGVKRNHCHDKDDEGPVKPEAMTMLESGAEFYRLLILSDGMCNGGPMSFHVRR